MEINKDYCIYVKNYSEWVEIQHLFFSKNIGWVGMHGKTLFTQWCIGTDLIFPRNLILSYHNKKGCYCISNVDNNIRCALSNEDNLFEIKAIEILRKNKLKHLNEK